MTFSMPSRGPGFIEDDREGLADLVAAGSDIDQVESHYVHLVDAAAGEFREFAGRGSEWAAFGRDLLSVMKDAVAADRYDNYSGVLRRRIHEKARSGVSYQTIAAALTCLRAALYGQAAYVFGNDPQRLSRLLRVGERYLARDLSVVLNETIRTSDERFAELHSKIGELKTPVIQVWEGVIAAPLVGAIDSARARQFTEDVLDEIVRSQAHAILIDITGVPVIDTAIANHLIKTMKAVSLLGARTYLVGLRPNIAQTLVYLGVSFEGIKTSPNFQAGLEAAIRDYLEGD